MPRHFGIPQTPAENAARMSTAWIGEPGWLKGEGDDLAAARGIGAGVVISALFAAAVILLGWLAT